ncbi:MAG: enoyl-[acyl-carrier-protein] reductase FabK [Clostridiales bacterium]|nr:enoyl-[acyl-carrier-protein] reductase FabK [Clostridiales bacterium]
MDLRDMLGIKYPIIQGGMANIATGEFAAAISNAGGLGLIAAGGLTTQQLRDNIRKAKALTEKPFGVNIMLMHPNADEASDIVIEEGVGVVTTGAGNPGKYMDKWKKAGLKVFPIVPSVAFARRMEKYGADGVIAEGTESGGHVGELTTMALVPQVVSAVQIPVVAAGGIASGPQMLAAFALGAVGVQIGTALLVSEECPIHINYKNAIIKAKDTDTTVTGRIAGIPVRILKNKMAREYLKREKEGANIEELELYTLGSLRKAVIDGDIHTGSLMSGQVAGQLKQIRPAGEIMEELFNDFRKAFEELKNSSLLNR